MTNLRNRVKELVKIIHPLTADWGSCNNCTYKSDSLRYDYSLPRGSWFTKTRSLTWEKFLRKVKSLYLHLFGYVGDPLFLSWGGNRRLCVTSFNIGGKMSHRIDLVQVSMSKETPISAVNLRKESTKLNFKSETTIKKKPTITFNNRVKGRIYE